MKKLKDVVRDLAIALLTGMAAGLVILLIFAVLGGLIGKSFENGILAGRSAVLLAGAACLIYSAGLLLKGGNLPAEAFRFRLKKRKEEPFDLPVFQMYRIVPRTYAALVTAAGILLISIIPDLILMSLG